MTILTMLKYCPALKLVVIQFLGKEQGGLGDVVPSSVVVSLLILLYFDFPFIAPGSCIRFSDHWTLLCIVLLYLWYSKDRQTDNCRADTTGEGARLKACV